MESFREAGFSAPILPQRHDRMASRSHARTSQLPCKHPRDVHDHPRDDRVLTGMFAIAAGNLRPRQKPRASKVSGARVSCLRASSWHLLNCSYTVELSDRITPQPARTYQGRRRILRRRNLRGARGNHSHIPNRKRYNGTCTFPFLSPLEPPPYPWLLNDKKPPVMSISIDTQTHGAAEDQMGARYRKAAER